MVIGIVALLILAGLFIVPTGNSSEVESGFGFWNVRLIAGLEDGSTQELNVATTYGAQLLAVLKDGQKITSITFIAEARATGEGFTSAELDMSNFLIGAFIGSDLVDAKHGSAGISLPLGSDFTDVFSFTSTVIIDELNECYNEGTHTLYFQMESGDYKYRGVPDGDWQTSTSFPISSLTVEVVGDTICYRCDGQGNLETMTTTTTCPSGWSSTPISPGDCECYTDTKYGTWSSWSNIGCSDIDCFMSQRRSRDILQGTICPGFVGPVQYVKDGTDYDYRVVYNSACCDTQYITCYQCDGSGGTNNQQFEGTSCPSGWSSSPPNCACYTDYKYGSWSDWVFQYCLSYNRHDRRERDVLVGTVCPGFIGPVHYTYSHTEYEWRIVNDPMFCLYGMSTISPSLFSVSSTLPESYRLSSTHYLGG